MGEHDGCAYLIVEECSKRGGCKRKELCPAGTPVYRNWTGGGHHHADQFRPDQAPNEKEDT